MEVKIGFNVYTKLDMAFRKDAVKLHVKFHSFCIEDILCTYLSIKTKSDRIITKNEKQIVLYPLSKLLLVI